jgi:HEAT repeat protein
MEALGKIGSEGAFIAIRDYINEHPESALIGLLPLAMTGKDKAIQCIQPYLSHEAANLRQAAVQALAAIRSTESLQILKERLYIECDEKVSSCLCQAVHSFRAVQFPDIACLQKIETIPQASTLT